VAAENDASRRDRDERTEKEVRDRLLSDPEVGQRLRDGVERLKLGNEAAPGVTRDALADLLRGSA